MIQDTITLVMIAGAGLLSLAAAVGALRFPDLLSRMHAASKPQLFGLVLVMFAVTVQVFQWGPISTMLLIVLFQLFTVPVAAHMVGRAGYRTKHLRRSMLYRDELSDAVSRAQAREVAERERGDKERADEGKHTA
ncbi:MULTISPECIES: monovalent cation/H(+) antiporter subunit G [Brevibacterium]|uniref:Monovalent cation/H(+) antiporter subunit G n=1 Tax=Brevibacterium salitolerans TaxID=1403566 RepID=A0ABP5I8P9_9MICO|nr:monovalent cation/H(+) antiporter subunit G [Brevibacterium sp.]